VRIHIELETDLWGASSDLADARSELWMKLRNYEKKTGSYVNS